MCSTSSPEDEPEPTSSPIAALVRGKSGLPSDTQVDFTQRTLSGLTARKDALPHVESCSSSKVEPQGYTICGARSGNEDYHNTSVWDDYALALVCDGHGGHAVARAVGEAFYLNMKESAAKLPHDATPVCLVETMRTCFHGAVESVDRTSIRDQGSTLSAALLQLQTMICATLQLGDGRIFAVRPSSGHIVDSPILYSIDDALPGSERMEDPSGQAKPCMSNSHDFREESEQLRYSTALHAAGRKLCVALRKDAAVAENRVAATVIAARAGALSPVQLRFVEPSRTVETLDTYPDWFIEQQLHLLQRRPEFLVWQLPERDVALFVTCDGFESKLALPSVPHIARCICDPSLYTASPFLDGTVIGGWVQEKNWWSSSFVKPQDTVWAQDPVTHTKKLLHHIAPDAAWKDAIDMSYNVIKSTAKADLSFACLEEDAQAAITVAANLAVLLGSDDNVTVAALIVADA